MQAQHCEIEASQFKTENYPKNNEEVVITKSAEYEDVLKTLLPLASPSVNLTSARELSLTNIEDVNTAVETLNDILYTSSYDSPQSADDSISYDVPTSELSTKRSLSSSSSQSITVLTRKYSNKSKSQSSRPISSEIGTASSHFTWGSLMNKLLPQSSENSKSQSKLHFTSDSDYNPSKSIVTSSNDEYEIIGEENDFAIVESVSKLSNTLATELQPSKTAMVTTPPTRNTCNKSIMTANTSNSDHRFESGTVIGLTDVSALQNMTENLSVCDSLQIQYQKPRISEECKRNLVPQIAVTPLPSSFNYPMLHYISRHTDIKVRSGNFESIDSLLSIKRTGIRGLFEIMPPKLHIVMLVVGTR